MKQTNYIVYHDSCLDGFLAGFITHYKALYDGIPNIVMVPLNYKESSVEAFANKVNSNDTLTIVDFSFNNKLIDELVTRGVQVTIVDHHKAFIENFFGESYIDKNFINNKKSYHLWSMCDCDNFSLFSNLVSNKTTNFYDLAVYSSYNDYKEKENQHKRSGAGLCLELLQHDKEFIKFLTTFAKEEIFDIINIAQQYDLWLHDGKPLTLANYLALWFYGWYDKQKVLRDKIINEPQNSNDHFIELKNLFISIPLETKIEEGANIYKERKEKIDELCIKAQRVIINPLSGIDSEKIKVGFIDSEEVAKLGISMTGSNLLKTFNYDVAIMVAITTKETITYSLRSDKERLDVDLTQLINNLVKANVAVSGGGHKNSAGITFVRLPNSHDNFFTPYYHLKNEKRN